MTRTSLALVTFLLAVPVTTAAQEQLRVRGVDDVWILDGIEDVASQDCDVRTQFDSVATSEYIEIADLNMISDVQLPDIPELTEMFDADIVSDFAPPNSNEGHTETQFDILAETKTE